jgi:predicted RNA methylase
MGPYATVSSQRGMNFDAVRNPCYERAIRQCVTADSLVLDLGAGLGMLGFLAARAGARKVYLVEPQPVIEVTRLVAEANGFENVECIQLSAEDLELPGPVDVIISVFTGNFLLTEDLLPALFLARDRFLAPGGVMLPDRARMIAAPVSAPDYYQERVGNWSLPEAAEHGIETYGIDYGAARPFSVNSLHYESAEHLGAELLAKPACLTELDFMTATEAACDGRIESEIHASGTCHGWLGWFDMRLGDEWLSTAPDAEPTHWRQVFMPLERPLPVKAGQGLSLLLKRPQHGEWTWTTEHAGELQRQSTFLSTPLRPDAMLRQSERFQPQLNRRGEAVRAALKRMDGGISTGQLADMLFREFPGVFRTREDAVRQVRALAEKYG